MKENSAWVLLRAEESNFGMMEDAMKETSRMARRMEKAPSYGRTAASILDHGEMISSTVSAYSAMPLQSAMASGSTASASDGFNQILASSDIDLWLLSTYK